MQLGLIVARPSDFLIRERIMIVEVYDKIPESGSVTERWFDAIGDCTWVQFVTDDGCKWAGVFGNGDARGLGSCKAALFGNDRTAMVVADGQGYVVDARTGELHHKTDRDDLCDVISVPGRDFVIVCDLTDLYAISANAEIWHSPRIALDGIKLESATEQMLAGKGWQRDDWHPFVLHFDGWRIQGDIYS